MLRIFRYVLSAAIFLLPLWSIVSAQEYSLRFYGHGPNDIDRVKIPIDAPHRPADVSHNFTIEFWMLAQPGDNTATVCAADQWYYGNIIIDRDVFGGGDYGDYGIALGNRRIMVGVEVGNNGTTGICGSTIVDDGVWHHIAVTRNASNGVVRLFVDGVIDATSSASSNTGNISYRDGRPTSYPNSDPYLVLGAEKHDYPGSLYYRGWLDELRISNTIRYSANFMPPSSPFTTDANTVALYHFNEGSGTIVNDVSMAAGGPSNGTLMIGGTPPGPAWSSMSPFSAQPVELDAFSAYRYPDGSVRLLWKTLSETNTEYFVVQRSTPSDLTWKAIGQVSAYGHSQKVLQYQFTDANPVANTPLYYRLQINDFDGYLTYSPVVSVSAQMDNMCSFYPNPFSRELHVRFADSSPWSIKLYNALGRLVLTYAGEGEHGLIIGEQLQPGLYIAWIEQNGFQWKLRAVKN